MDFSILSWIVFTPLIGTILILFVPREMEKSIKGYEWFDCLVIHLDVLSKRSK
ncbi:hypothetical protein KKB54_00425 [bacterium]|nr:hypothetical protein [bacterium]MBU1153992.1 hypothetical protein [bacterium]